MCGSQSSLCLQRAVLAGTGPIRSWRSCLHERHQAPFGPSASQGLFICRCCFQPVDSFLDLARVVTRPPTAAFNAAISCCRSVGAGGTAVGVSPAYNPPARNRLRQPLAPQPPLPIPRPGAEFKRPGAAFPAQKPRPRPVIGPCPSGPVLSPNGISIPPYVLKIDVWPRSQNGARGSPHFEHTSRTWLEPALRRTFSPHFGQVENSALAAPGHSLVRGL